MRVAIIGVGNCANAFVQGVHYYQDADPREAVPGLMHVDLGGYHVRDIEFSAAFDIDAEKVGKDLSEAIWSGQNNTIKFADDVPHLGVPVQRGMTHDGLGKYLKEKITKAEGSTVDIVQVLKDTKTDVVVSYLPVGSEQATKWYVEQILEAGCGFVNCIPVFIAREDYWNNRFKKAGLPIVGDDIKSQVGATIVHRSLARLFGDRGVKLMRTSQLNVGGNMDFYNMLERERLESKKISKTNAVTSIMDHELPADDVYIGPSDYVPWLTDRKWAHIRLEGQAFGDVPLTAEMKLEVWDSPNSAGIVTDAVRCCKLAHEPRHRRPARRPVLLPHEVALHAAAGRPGPRGDRGVHRPARARARRPRRPARRRSRSGRGQVRPPSPTSDPSAAASAGPSRVTGACGDGHGGSGGLDRLGAAERGDGEGRGEGVAGAGGVDLVDLGRGDDLRRRCGRRAAPSVVQTTWSAAARGRAPRARPRTGRGRRRWRRARAARGERRAAADVRVEAIRPPAARTRAAAASTTARHRLAERERGAGDVQPVGAARAASPRSASASAPGGAHVEDERPVAGLVVGDEGAAGGVRRAARTRETSTPSAASAGADQRAEGSSPTTAASAVGRAEPRRDAGEDGGRAARERAPNSPGRSSGSPRAAAHDLHQRLADGEDHATAAARGSGRRRPRRSSPATGAWTAAARQRDGVGQPLRPRRARHQARRASAAAAASPAPVGLPSTASGGAARQHALGRDGEQALGAGRHDDRLRAGLRAARAAAATARRRCAPARRARRGSA